MANAAPKTQLGHDQNSTKTTTKFLASFLYKVVTATLFLVLVPVLTSQPPQFVILTGRSWEVLHIVLVGIAVSYGMFSRWKEAGGAEEEDVDRLNPNSIPGKFENAQSYVNRFLQLSSLFDDESDAGCGGGSLSLSPTGSDGGRFQSSAWNIQYIRNKPVLVVDEDRNGGSSIRISNKPLLLPIRSLRSSVSDEPRGNSGEPSALLASVNRSGSNSSRSCVPDDARDDFDVYGVSNAGSISKRVPNGSNTRGYLGEAGLLLDSLNRSGSNPGSISKRAPCCGLNRTREGRVYDTESLESENNMKDIIILPSPIPWRSRSGRMETRDGADSAGDTRKADAIVESRSIRPQFSRSLSTTAFWPNPVLSPSTLSFLSPKKVSPSSSLSSTSSEAKVVTFPPPSPPPLTTTFKLPSEKPSLVAPMKGVSMEKHVSNNLSSSHRDVSRSHPKSVRTIRASGEAIPRTSSGKDLGENFFDGLLGNDGLRHDFFKETVIEDEETQSKDYANDNGAASVEDLGVPKNREVLSVDEESISNSTRCGWPDVDKKADEFIAKFREQIWLQRVKSIKRSSKEISSNSAR